MRMLERVRGGSFATAFLVVWIHSVAFIGVSCAFLSPPVVVPSSASASRTIFRLDAIRIDETTTSTASTASTTTAAEPEQYDHAQQRQEEDEDPEDEDWMTARSCFGEKSFWDDVYAGRGGFPADEYSWYYDWNVLQRHLASTPGAPTVDQLKDQRVLIPGCGNDPLLATLVRAGFRQLAAQDYSRAAVDRQRDLLWDANPQAAVHLSVSSVLKPLPYEPESFDLILEKGLLDAVHLAHDDDDDDGSVVQRAVQHLTQTLKRGGIFVSVSGVVPPEVRARVFERMDYQCLRDGRDDLTAGCFIFRKP